LFGLKSAGEVSYTSSSGLIFLKDFKNNIGSV